jgi:hypothetical protein
LAPGWGLLPRHKSGLRSIAAKRIAQVGGAIDWAFPREQLVFVTLTLPGSSPRALRDFARVSSYCLNLIKARLSKRFGKQPPSFHVWEHQKRGALHWHMCIALDSPPAALLFAHDWHDIAIDTLKAAEREYQVDLWERKGFEPWLKKKGTFENQDAQIVRKSVVEYLSKYLKKGLAHARRRRRRHHYSPARYWGCSNTARDMARAMTATDIAHFDQDQVTDHVEYDAGTIARHGAQWGVSWMSEWHTGMRGQIFRYPSYEAAHAAYHAIATMLAKVKGIFGAGPLAKAPPHRQGDSVTDQWQPSKQWIAKRLHFEQQYRNGTAPILRTA